MHANLKNETTVLFESALGVFGRRVASDILTTRWSRLKEMESQADGHPGLLVKLMARTLKEWMEALAKHGDH